MAHEIALTFGTKDILQRIQSNNPQNQLISLSETGSEERLLLLDTSQQPGVFANPITYTSIMGVGEITTTPLLAFTTLQLDADHAKILRASITRLLDQQLPTGLTSLHLLENKKNSNAFLLLTNWEDMSAYYAWPTSPSFELLKPFYKQTQFNYRAVTYTPIDLSK
ncbi:antibiotic biosynthesis monooxygenase [Furfurilactobacillus siliginis]|uniref:ABM domain-containing protein n=1 Tax=Furfurilactobacillus siliginis TaxID=348151 RepID=A0A0R2L9T3_9LACO|nr:antibiotic biosynthesis monooxygenase [Furfurilactobacillus siliginis]KRN96092.1 hypothetical protein IV55_GL001472 [Furfurilactobacillus siliginis]GEK27984.1 hypothetical protein LSI01_02950 [Furfurilactobacillus siliginis]